MQLLQDIAKHLQYILFQCSILLQETVFGQICLHFLKKKYFLGSVFFSIQSKNFNKFTNNISVHVLACSCSVMHAL